MSEQERIIKAQEMLAEIESRYGVRVAATTSARRIEGGSLIVDPQPLLVIIPEWKAPPDGDSSN